MKNVNDEEWTKHGGQRHDESDYTLCWDQWVWNI
jgi:hypothetical protein